MGLLSIETIKEGMILDEDLQSDGQILIKSGVVLTERHLKLCRSWGIEFLPIKDLEASQVEQDFFASIDPEVMAKAEEIAQEDCRHLTLDIPLHQDLYQLHLRRILQKGIS